MCKVIRRLVSAFFVILMLVSLFPFQVFAVDPVSAATMANALAQALTAYGASHGVSMTFDVASTDGIGEGMHELWNNFKTYINDNNVPTYDSLANTMWATIYTKIGNYIGININDTEIPYIDAFWNWLLSGPAEMQKVDDQYYQFASSSSSIGVLTFYDNLLGTIHVSVNNLPVTFFSPGIGNTTLSKYTPGQYDDYFTTYTYNANDANPYKLVVISKYRYRLEYSNPSGAFNLSEASSSGWYWTGGTYSKYVRSSDVDQSALAGMTIDDLYNYLVANPSITLDQSQTGLSVSPYVGAANLNRVYIPDNEDVNYQPLPYVGGLDVPWSTDWGDGETITDAIGTSIAGALDTDITTDGTLTLAGDVEDNPDIPSGEVIGGPDSYQVPGLADVFPFCIPFDIYHFLQALSAEPTPPHFTATLAFPEAVGGSQQIDIDFDTPTFNQIAAILRTMELLAFCIGLALLTRSMFIRG